MKAKISEMLLQAQDSNTKDASKAPDARGGAWADAPSQPQKALPSDTFTPDVGPLVQRGNTFLYHQYVMLSYPALANEHRSSCLMESRARQWCGT